MYTSSGSDLILYVTIEFFLLMHSDVYSTLWNFILILIEVN